MYTGTLINDLLAVVERAENYARPRHPDSSQCKTNGAGTSAGRQDDCFRTLTREPTVRTVPAVAWSERG